MTTRQISWLSLLDQDELAEGRNPIEYEFTAPGGGRGMKNERTHDGGSRVFRGRVASRGAYADDATVSGGLTWGSVQIVWDGDEITWGTD